MTLSPETLEALKGQVKAAHPRWVGWPGNSDWQFEQWLLSELQAAAVVAVEQAEAKYAIELRVAVDNGNYWRQQFDETAIALTKAEAELAALRRLPVYGDSYNRTTAKEAGDIIRQWLECGQHFGDSCLVPVAQFVDKLIEKRLPTGGGMTVEGHIQCLTDECFPITDRLTFEKLAGQHLQQAVAEAVAAAEVKWQDDCNRIVRAGQEVLASQQKRRAKELQEAVAAEREKHSGVCLEMGRQYLATINKALADQRERHAAELATIKRQHENTLNYWQNTVKATDAQIARAEQELAQERSNWQARLDRVESENKEWWYNQEHRHKAEMLKAVAAAYEKAAQVAKRYREQQDEKDAIHAAKVAMWIEEDIRKLASERAAKPQEPEKPANGVDLIAAERMRQINQEGWSPEHDNTHQLCELGDAARAYASYGLSRALGQNHLGKVPREWPESWDSSWWKPSIDPVRNLVKAGALIAAEIDRLQRAKAPIAKPQEPTEPWPCCNTCGHHVSFHVDGPCGAAACQCAGFIDRRAAKPQEEGPAPCKHWNQSVDYVAYPCGDDDCLLHGPMSPDEKAAAFMSQAGRPASQAAQEERPARLDVPKRHDIGYHK